MHAEASEFYDNWSLFSIEAEEKEDAAKSKEENAWDEYAQEETCLRRDVKGYCRYNQDEPYGK